MGVTISSKRFSVDMGYFGYSKFRTKVAEQVSKEVGEHYAELFHSRNRFEFDGTEEEYFKIYDAKTEEFVKNKILTNNVANFLYQADCDGKIDRKQAKEVYELIKNCDNDIKYGYSGRQDCATMKEMKLIFNDKTKVSWY